MRAFIIMPFGEGFDEVFNELIAPPLREHGYEVNRADLSADQGQILRDIISMLKESDIVIADLTGLNPNVMYELGLAHAMFLNTILITRDISELPFDLRPYRAFEYSTSFTEAPKLLAKIRDMAIKAGQGQIKFSNPVIDFAPDLQMISSGGSEIHPNHQTFPRVDEINDRSPGILPPDKDGALDHPVLDGADEPGLLDYIVELNRWGDETLAVSARISESTIRLSERITSRTEELRQAQEKLGTKGAVVYQKIMKETAVEVSEFASEVEENTPQLTLCLEGLTTSANGLAQLRNEPRSQNEIDSLRGEIASITAAEEKFGETSASLTNFAEVLIGMPNMERTLTAASKRAGASVNEAERAIEQGRTDLSRVRGILESRITSEWKSE